MKFAEGKRGRKKRVTNVIQTQRDYMGALTYERVDVKGKFYNEEGVIHETGKSTHPDD